MDDFYELVKERRGREVCFIVTNRDHINILTETFPTETKGFFEGVSDYIDRDGESYIRAKYTDNFYLGYGPMQFYYHNFSECKTVLMDEICKTATISENDFEEMFA